MKILKNGFSKKVMYDIVIKSKIYREIKYKGSKK